jgi:hypothetical protein
MKSLSPSDTGPLTKSIRFNQSSEYRLTQSVEVRLLSSTCLTIRKFSADVYASLDIGYLDDLEDRVMTKA